MAGHTLQQLCGAVQVPIPEIRCQSMAWRHNQKICDVRQRPHGGERPPVLSGEFASAVGSA